MAADLKCELLHVGNQARNMRRGLTGPPLAYRSSVPICPRNIASRSEDSRHRGAALGEHGNSIRRGREVDRAARIQPTTIRSEEHTSELQSLRHLVCRLLLE